MKLHPIFVLLGLLYSSASLGWVTAHSGEDTIRVVTHTADISVDGPFVKTTIGLTFANRGQQKEGAIYQFNTDYGASVTNLEIKIGKTWQKGVLLESNQAREAYSAITGLDATPRNIDPGLMTKDSAGGYTLFVYPVPAGGVLEARYTIVSRVQFDGEVYYYTYPDAGDETIVSPKLNISIIPPTGRTIASAMFIEQEAKLITGKGLGTQVQVKQQGQSYGGTAELSWTLKPPSAAVPTPTFEMYTAAGAKNDSFLFLSFALDPLTPAQLEMGDTSTSYQVLAVTYDTPLPEGSFCAGNQPYSLDPGTSYWLACWLSGAAPKSAQTYLNKDGVALEKPISSLAKASNASTLAAIFLAEIEDNYFFDQLSTQQEKEDYDAAELKARERFFTAADRYNVVTTMTSLLAIDPSDEFSRDVVAFAKKWGSRYAAQMLSQSFSSGSSIGFGSGGSSVYADKVPPPSKPSIAKSGGVGDKPLPLDGGSPSKFFDPFDPQPPTTGNSLALTASAPSKVLSGVTADRDKIVATINASPHWGKCMKDLKLKPESALQLKIKDGMIAEVSFLNTDKTTACSGVLQLMTFSKVSVEFVILLSSLPGKQ